MQDIFKRSNLFNRFLLNYFCLIHYLITCLVNNNDVRCQLGTIKLNYLILITLWIILRRVRR